MKLIIISGRSGSGKSTALNLLEDAGFYCIDNLPVILLETLTDQASQDNPGLSQLAVSIDARNLPNSLAHFPNILEKIKTDQSNPWHTEVIYLDAQEDTLISRFSSTRRKHPLSNENTSLAEAINNEKELLDPIARVSDLNVDTTLLSVHQLRSQIKDRVLSKGETPTLALQFQSFGFKHGNPVDADYVFDVRCLPNPYWDPSLRSFTGLDKPVQKFLEKESAVSAMIDDIANFLLRWIPLFEENNRSYMTVAIGCTGGQHRSVYVSEALGRLFSARNNIQVRHRELTLES